MERRFPDELEENPGAGIRVNGDDDNANSSPDRNDTTVADENHLIEVTLDIQPPPPSGLPCVLKRSGGNIRVWVAQNKSEVILGGNAEADLQVTQAAMTFWIENPAGGAADLQICVKESNATSAPLDTIHFYPFTSIVIALGGEGQEPADPPLEPTNHGTFHLANRLYELGYDVHMYDEQNLDDEGAGAVYDEVERAVQRRNLSQVAIFGYSHGGGSTHDLSERHDNDRAATGTFTIPFTAYIDAVENDSNQDSAQERRRPPGSSYHVNYR